MNKRYLGDVRDLFKYDLIQRILEGIKSLQGFTFIPMLTEYDPESRGGNERDFSKAKEDGRPGTKNEKLIESLKSYKDIEGDKRDFTEIKKHFQSCDFEVRIYKERGNKYFTNNKRMRDKYFENILVGLLHKSLVLVDPDIGLQIENSTEKHLLYSEVKYLYDHMDEDSLLMIYQHFPQARRTHKKYLPAGRSKELEKEIGDLPLYISDNEIFFLFLAKNDKLKKQLERIINRYKSDYPSLISVAR